MSDTTPESQARAATAALIRDYYAAFNRGDTDAMLDFLTDDVIHDVNQGERRQGKEKFRAFNARMTHNYKEELKDIVVLVSKDATRAAAEFNVHGVYKNTEEGLPDAVGQKYVQLQPGVLDSVVREMDIWSQRTSEFIMTRAREEMSKRGHSLN